ncbi:efflux RND transporter periplasmic adaptor subunit [Methylobacter sp. YRD-M1]|uniref:efflux RND transporter periplasmic adaptor subunit n=1 Tax=Methylobacter sp. YRD-M1 TaxID=2911520 RepID=UPI00227CA4D7|nr:efflux RND transporter periplasmic adaptor subunit [Methylobacter sp. YRD-M1]WAK03762.1 efflux RND transporter periplasmic adaptor subunit [Methylobacter sp. YRD-M1]
MRPLKIIIILAIITGIAVAVWYAGRPKLTDENTLTLYGNIDIRQVGLSFHDTEYIAAMHVKEGDQVKQGQLLAMQDLERFQYTMDNAKAKAEAQRQVVARLEAGSRVEDIRKAQADVKSAQASVAFAQKEFDRIQALVKRKSMPQQSLDRARSELDAARERMRSLKELHELAVIGPRVEDIAEARAQLEAAESAFKLAKKAWQDAHLYAPADGIIQDRILEPGDMASTNTPVYTLALIDPVWARTYVPENRLGRLKYGMPARIRTDSYPDKVYDGWVGFISPTAEFTPKTVETPELRTSLVYQVRVFACNPQNELRLGMPVTVNIPLAESSASPPCKER